MRILLVEDDAQLAESVSDALTAHRYVVDVAQDGESGWEQVKEQDFDLILLVKSTPSITGIVDKLLPLVGVLLLFIVIVAEMFIGAEQGLGKRIIDAQQILNVKDMYASILITGMLGYCLNMLFLLIEKRFVHWSGK